MNFQRRLAISPTSLHTVAVIVVIAWVVVGSASPLTHDCNMGLWHLLPGAVRHNGWVNQLLAIITMVVSVYTLHELNLSHVMLRINSRTISFVFAALMTACVFLHAFQPGLVVMYFILLSLFFLFSTYHQESSAGNTFVAFLCLSIGAVFYPKLLWMVPIYMLSIYMLRALNPRSVSGAVLGVIAPFWVVGSIAYVLDEMAVFSRIMHQMVDFEWGGYAQHSASQTIMIWLTFAIFLIGTIDFLMRNYLDKTRVRVHYYVVILHGVAYFLLLLLQPLSCHSILPLAIVFTAFMGGHFVSNDYTPLSNILVWVFTVLILGSFILSAWIL